MVIAALAWNIKSWFALMMHRKSDRSEYIRMEFRRFIHSIILIPCRVMRRARTITLRLIGYQLDRFSAWRTSSVPRVVHGHSEGRCSLHAHRAATAWPRTPTL